MECLQQGIGTTQSGFESEVLPLLVVSREQQIAQHPALACLARLTAAETPCRLSTLCIGPLSSKLLPCACNASTRQYAVTQNVACAHCSECMQQRKGCNYVHRLRPRRVKGSSSTLDVSPRSGAAPWATVLRMSGSVRLCRSCAHQAPAALRSAASVVAQGLSAAACSPWVARSRPSLPSQAPSCEQKETTGVIQGRRSLLKYQRSGMAQSLPWFIPVKQDVT